MKKRFIAVMLLFILSFDTVYGAVLGGKIEGWSHKIANGTDLYKNEFNSSQQSVGKQTEYYTKMAGQTSVLHLVR